MDKFTCQEGRFDDGSGPYSVQHSQKGQRRCGRCTTRWLDTLGDVSVGCRRCSSSVSQRHESGSWSPSVGMRCQQDWPLGETAGRLTSRCIKLLFNSVLSSVLHCEIQWKTVTHQARRRTRADLTAGRRIRGLPVLTQNSWAKSTVRSWTALHWVCS